MKKITANKKANFEYNILKTFTAGLVLKGLEVKSIRNGGMSINDSYCTIVNGEVYLLNAFIKAYDKATNVEIDQKRSIKLLLNKSEISKLIKCKEEGESIIPLFVNIDRHLIKIVIATAKGKKLYDKRQTIKERELDRQIKKTI